MASRGPTKDRQGKTPWMVVLIHAPWYNSNNAHQGENESVSMKEAMEDLLYHAHVDVVFAGHVHAYERFTRVYKDKSDNCGPVHITMEMGVTVKASLQEYMDPKPDISIFREASFGHGILEVVNASHALWTGIGMIIMNQLLVTLSGYKFSSNPACKA
ncbi:Metallo-dependent phosphatase-like [Sesbania bispinosa]|nr:Metallo-dependent phosphatase-like [Sesbania bispinosa]